MYGARQNQIISQNSVGSRAVSQPMEYPYYNRNSNEENYEMHSTSNDCRSIVESQFSQRRKNPSDEICSLFSNSLETSIPRIADQCVNIILSKIEAEISKQNNYISKLKEEIKTLKESIIQYPDTDFKNIENIIFAKITKIQKEIEDKQKSLESVLSKNQNKGGKNLEKITENIHKYLKIIKSKSGEQSNQYLNLASSLNDQNGLNDVCLYLDETIKNITSNYFVDNKIEKKDVFNVEDFSKKLEIVNEFLEEKNKIRIFQNMAVSHSVNLSFIDMKNVDKNQENPAQRLQCKEDYMKIDEISIILNNFDKMKNIKPKIKRKQQNKVKNVNLYSQFYF